MNNWWIFKWRVYIYIEKKIVWSFFWSLSVSMDIRFKSVTSHHVLFCILISAIWSSVDRTITDQINLSVFLVFWAGTRQTAGGLWSPWKQVERCHSPVDMQEATQIAAQFYRPYCCTWNAPFLTTSQNWSRRWMRGSAPFAHLSAAASNSVAEGRKMLK